LTRPGDDIRWEWSQPANDWVDVDTGECLTGYEPSDHFKTLVSSLTATRADLPAVRSIAPESGTDDVNFLRELMAKRLDAHIRERAPFAPPEVISKQLQKIFALRPDQARTIAAEITGTGPSQLDLLPRASARELTRRRRRE
jgi:hypothetical protein